LPKVDTVLPALATRPSLRDRRWHCLRIHPDGQTHADGWDPRAGWTGWLTGGPGIRWLSGDGLDPVALGYLGVGAWVIPELSVDLSGQIYWPLGDVVETNVSGAGQTRFIGLTLQASFWVVPEWSLTAGIGTAPLAESNAAVAALTLGFEQRFWGW
jgi:hypothetical protein